MRVNSEMGRNVTNISRGTFFSLNYHIRLKVLTNTEKTHRITGIQIEIMNLDFTNVKPIGLYVN
jgi:hypothetical protein